MSRLVGMTNQCRQASGRSGAVLLEVIVAVVVFASVALASIILVRQSALTMEHIHKADTETQAASAFLDAVSLWPREDLDQRLGERRQGAWLLYIDRPTQTLYRIVVLDSASRHPILETALFRPDGAGNE